MASSASSSSTAPSPLADVVSSLPLTWPVPSPVDDASLVPSSDIALEQDLLLNADSLRAWTAYIAHITAANYQRRSPPDVRFSPAEARLLGPLASADNRLALRRIVGIYERALARFPASYTLHRDYLFARARFVLGEPRGGYDALRKRINHTTRRNLLDVDGPSLVAEDDQGDDEWQWQWQQGGALDGTVGYKEWLALVAACERSLQWMAKMPRIHLFYLSLFLHPLCPAPLSLTHARRTFDRSLRLLPPSLHPKVWKLYLRWAEQKGGETGLRVWRRYLRVDPSLTERYVRLLLTTRALHRRKTGDEEEEDAASDDEDDSPSPSPGPRALEAAKLLLRLAADAAKGTYKSPEGKSPHQLFIEWLELVDRYPEETGLDEDEEADVVRAASASSSASHSASTTPAFPRPQDVSPNDTSRLPVRSILLATLPRYPDQAGRLWTGLATYHLKRGELDLAKATFQEGMRTVVTVRDFSVIFDAFAESEEGVISYLMSELEDEGEHDGGGGDVDDADEEERAQKEAELDTRIKEFEDLMESRPFLVNDVMLRRNPDDVQEWEKRVALHGDDDEQVKATYASAVETVNPRKATANHHCLFLNYARFHEVGGSAGLRILEALRRDPAAEPPANDEDLPLPDVEGARRVFEKAVTIPFKRVDDLAEVWISWAEMELRHADYAAALRVMARAVQVPARYARRGAAGAAGAGAAAKHVSYHDDSLPAQLRLFKSLKLWSFYSDLEESIGSTAGAQRVYDAILELKIANAQTIINYAAFLEERGYHEEAFRVYERGTESFGWPVAFEVWNVYLSRFIRRYGGAKIERARDLFEQALAACDTKFSKVLFLKYGALEEEYGLAKRAMRIYERATQQVAASEQFDMYAFYIAKTASSFGLPATRAIYTSAIEVLPPAQTAEMCLRFASLERKLGEVDRARAIYKYAAQFCDPRVHANFWREWNAFEVQTGSEDTFREMLRVKRSVQAQYSTDLRYVEAAARRGAAEAAAASGASGAKGAAGGGGASGAGAAGAGTNGAAGSVAVPVDPMAQLELQQRAGGGVAATGMFVSARTEQGGGKRGAGDGGESGSGSEGGSGGGSEGGGGEALRNEERVGGKDGEDDDEELM